MQVGIITGCITLIALSVINYKVSPFPLAFLSSFTNDSALTIKGEQL